MTILEELISDVRFLGLFAMLTAFVVSTAFYLYPNIISVSKIKGLMDAPGDRKMHAAKTPTLGGLGVFIAFSLTIIFGGLAADLVQADLVKLLALFGSLIIVVFLGIKDDLISVTPKGKFLGQLVAVVNVVVLTDVRILSFDGLLGIGELPYVVSVLFSIFVFILVINALNLIDGIDGLAASIAIIASTTFGILFLVYDDYLMTLVSTILVGSLFGFLKYNLSSKKKIFMGDCGSMLTGFLLAYQGVAFLALNGVAVPPGKVANAPILLLAVLSYPLFDLLRVFAIRIKQKRSPFSADSNHIHHRLLRLGLDHKMATLLLCLSNAAVIVFAFMWDGFDIHWALLASVGFGAALYLLPFLSIFETPIAPESIEEVKVATQQSVVNDTFEFELKPLNLFDNGNRVTQKKKVESEKVKTIGIDTNPNLTSSTLKRIGKVEKRAAVLKKVAHKN